MDRSATNISTASRLSNRGLVAKRGRGRRSLTAPSGRQLVKQSALKPGPCFKETPTPEPSAPSSHPSVPRPDTIKTGVGSTIRASPLLLEKKRPNPPQNNPPSRNRGASLVHDISRTVSNENFMQADQYHSPGQMRPPDASTMQTLPAEALQSMKGQSVKQPPPDALKRKPAPVTNMEPASTLIRDSKADASKSERVQVAAHLQLSLTTHKLSDDTIVLGVPKQTKPSPDSASTQQAIPDRFVETLPKTKGGDKGKSKFGPLLPKGGRSDFTSEADVKAPDASPPKLSTAHAKFNTKQTNGGPSSEIWAPVAEPMDVDADDDEANMADVSDSSDEEDPKLADPKPVDPRPVDPNPADTAMLSFRARSEARRKKMMARFDSAAFDSFIYQQSDLRPPEGVSIRNGPSGKAAASSEENRIFLPVNPAIHKMHNRSQEWYRKKCQEIKSRPGRKAWFGKVVERQRWLRAREAKLDEERQRARLAGTIPPFKAPQPQGYRRIMDFGDVPEEELPEEVRNNPAWLKACAWHRECMNKGLQRQRVVNKTTEETERFFREAFGGTPFE
ncbi:hypothetical protein FDECE_17094 [Fusarium decemcellulare]|nr:hypothetical protein FDECE_17094 [Fusarium decemcellulare]